MEKLGTPTTDYGGFFSSESNSYGDFQDYYTVIGKIEVGCSEGKIVIEDKSYNFVKFYSKIRTNVSSSTINEVAKIANIFFHGSQYELIIDINNFKEIFYDHCKKFEEMPYGSKYLDFDSSPILCYKSIDLNQLHIPKIIEKRLVFFVEQKLIPYRVNVHLDVEKATYELLS